MLTVAICVELVSTWVAVGEFNAQRGETGALDVSPQEVMPGQAELAGGSLLSRLAWGLCQL